MLLTTVPFAGQAFHIDDAIFWDFAKNALDKPFSLHLDDYHLMGEDINQWRDTHPPLDSLYMSLLMRVTGSDQEWPLHLGFIIFPLLAGLSMYSLSRRFTGNALLATLLLLATPAFMVQSHTLMADVPLLSLWLAATAAYIHGVDNDDMRMLLFSSLLVTLAIFSGYQALALFILLPAYPLLRRGLSWRNTLPFLFPAAAFLAFALANVAGYGQLPRFSHARGTSVNPYHVLDRIEGMLLHIGATSIFPLCMVAIFSLRRRRYLILPVIIILASVLGLVRYGQGSLSGTGSVLYVVFLAAAVTLLTAVVIEAAIQLIQPRQKTGNERIDTDFIFLAFWLLLMMVSTIILLPHVTAKYTLTFAAPVAILAMREMEWGLSARGVRALALTTLVLTLTVGLAVSAADFRLAGSYRDFVAGFAANDQGDRTVWFVGEWGFRHYMEAEGYRYLSSNDTSPETGDLIVKPAVADWPLAPSVESRINLTETHESRWSIPLRLMSMEADAGFYGTYWGILPYSIADVPVETIEIFEVGEPAP